METFSVVIDGSQLNKAIKKMINKSAYFAVQPLPDDAYEVTVKTEEDQKVIQKIKEG
jgi:hypothetical protein